MEKNKDKQKDVLLSYLITRRYKWVYLMVYPYPGSQREMKRDSGSQDDLWSPVHWRQGAWGSKGQSEHFGTWKRALFYSFDCVKAGIQNKTLKQSDHLERVKLPSTAG